MDAYFQQKQQRFPTHDGHNAMYIGIAASHNLVFGYEISFVVIRCNYLSCQKLTNFDILRFSEPGTS